MYLNICPRACAEPMHRDSGERNLRFLELLSYLYLFQSFVSTSAASCHKRALLPSIFPSDVLRLPLLCGIPYSKLIKTIQLIVASDNKGREHAPQGSQILKHSLSIWFIPDCKIFWRANPPTGWATSHCPPSAKTLCVLVFLFRREREEIRGGGRGWRVSLALRHNKTKSLAFNIP